MAPGATQTITETLPAQNESSYVPHGDVTATLNFFDPPADGTKPYQWVEKQTDGRPQNNYGNHCKTVTIHDIRNSESAYNLDKDAFQAKSGVSSAVTEEDWTNDETIQRVYYPEVVKLILDSIPGTHKVTVFEHTIRGQVGNRVKRVPIHRVHLDQTRRSTVWRIQLHDPEEADTLLKGRYRIVNVWRPLNGPVQSHPLAFASADTVEDNDIRPVELRCPHRTGETAGVLYNPGQKFYYWSGMKNDERLFLKCCDSVEGVGKSVPHTSFVDDRTPKGAKARASVEVRTIVYG